jgi:hypothetical protein
MLTIFTSLITISNSLIYSVSCGLSAAPAQDRPVGTGAGTGSPRCRPVPVPLIDRKKRFNLDKLIKLGKSRIESRNFCNI